MHVHLRRSDVLATRGRLDAPTVVRVGMDPGGQSNTYWWIPVVLFLAIGAAAIAFGDVVARKALA